MPNSSLSGSSSSVVADLHLHTNCSDGALSPAELVHTVADAGLRAMSITDHDTLAGWEEGRQAADDAGITLVPGVELSVSVDGHEVHLLAYGIDPDHDGLNDHLDAFMQARVERAEAIVDRLQSLGVGVGMDDVRKEAGEAAALGRPHVAAALVSAGASGSIDAAFRDYLGTDAPAYVSKPDVPVAEVLDLVHDAGGIGVLAHPGQWTPTSRIRTLIDRGLDGIEIVHPSHESYLVSYYERMANGRGLLATGGSDYHGTRPGDDDRLGRFGLDAGRWHRVADELG
jgi:predicted metal-dependent phosphoesterase TrpH